MSSAYSNKELAAAGVAVLDCEHRTPKAQVHGFPYIAIPNIVSGRIDLSASRRISGEDLADWTKRTVPQDGDILVTRRGRVGDTGVIPDGLQCAIGQNLVLLRSNGREIRQDFLRWASRSPQWWSEVERLLNVGAIFSSLNVRDIARIKIPVPPIADQRSIAEVLGALDDKVAANTRLATCADELAGLVFDVAIAGAPLGAMSSMLTPVLGGTPTRARSDYWGGDRLWASAKDVTGAPFGIVIATQESITAEAVSQTRAKPLPKGSVLLTARGTVGAVARLGSPSSLNQSCYGFVPGDFPPGVLYFSILRATDRAKAFAHGSVFDTITMRTFDHLEVVNMPGSELRRVEARVGPLLAKVEQVVRENESLTAMRDALLPQLMSGKIRVKDAEQRVGDVV